MVLVLAALNMFLKIILIIAIFLFPQITVTEISHGRASWYSINHRMANGEMYDRNAYTAAHRTLPFGTDILVQNISNGKTVVVKISDRGPYRHRNRIIDLSHASAIKLGMIHRGLAKVKLYTIS